MALRLLRVSSVMVTLGSLPSMTLPSASRSCSSRRMSMQMGCSTKSENLVTVLRIFHSSRNSSLSAVRCMMTSVPRVAFSTGSTV